MPEGSRLKLFGNHFPRYQGTRTQLAVEEYYKVAQKHKNQSFDIRKTIIQNIIEDFGNSMLLAFERISYDAKHNHEFREVFNIESCVIKSIQVLGEETHKKGSSPLSIEVLLHNSNKIIYKPRSLLAEKNIWLLILPNYCCMKCC